jgi:hypothetical protein
MPRFAVASVRVLPGEDTACSQPRIGFLARPRIAWANRKTGKSPASVPLVQFATTGNAM